MVGIRKRLKWGFELQFQGALQTELGRQVLAPPGVDSLHQATANALGVFLAMGAAQPHEGGVGIAVDHRVAFGLDQLAGTAHHLSLIHI